MAKKKTETMFWVLPVSNEDGNQVKLFGKPATLNEDGYYEVEVEADAVENEKARVCSRLIDADEYKAFLKKVKK